MENVLFETSKNLKSEKVLNGLKLIEEYLPDMMKTVHDKLKCPIDDNWTKNEQRKLKAAKEFYPIQEFMREPEDRWKYVSGFVNTKTLEECKEEVQFQEAVKKSKAESKSKTNEKKKPYISGDQLGLNSKEEVKNKVEEEDDDDDEYDEDNAWKNQKKVVGKTHKVTAAKNALHNSAKTLIRIDGKL